MDDVSLALLQQIRDDQTSMKKDLSYLVERGKEDRLATFDLHQVVFGNEKTGEKGLIGKVDAIQTWINGRIWFERAVIGAGIIEAGAFIVLTIRVVLGHL
jgi:hypothetical protein